MARSRPLGSRAELKVDAQAELPSSHLCEVPSCESSNLPRGFGIDVSVRLTQVDVVEGVEELGAELSIDSFRHPQSFAKSGIGIEETGAVERIESYVPKASHSRTLPRAPRAAVSVESVGSCCRGSAAVAGGA